MLALAVLTLISLQFLALDGAPQIVLPNGAIIGREDVTITNKTFFAFEKIPYARPPLGELRFKAPIPAANWDEPLETLHLDVFCYQVSSDSDYETEDCLYLNVFTPELPTEDNNVSLPVMFYIHGGGFVDGSGSGLYGDRFIDEDIVLVVINYRLGIFGFLSTQDEIIPGNNGLKDQHLALQWAHDNIQLFGGDPDKITIFGESAGSASCAYHLINQESRGAILQSGSFLSPWAFQRRAKDIAFATAAFLNESFATNRNSQDLFGFLQGVDARDLDAAAAHYHDVEYGPQDAEILQGFYWAPVVEAKNADAFLTRKMYGLLQAGNVVPNVPILIGMTSEEGLIFYPDPESFKGVLQQYDDHPDWLVPNDMIADESTNRTAIGLQIRDIYTDGEPLVEHLGAGLRYTSDTAITRSVIKHAELYSQFAPTYFYQFSYEGQLGHFDNHYEGTESVGHAQDLIYFFCGGAACDISGYPDSDQITKSRLIRIWSNFAKYQNPTPEVDDDLLQNITWPLVSTSGGDFFYVNINDTLEILNHPKEATYSKWVQIYDSLDFSDFDTY